MSNVLTQPVEVAETGDGRYIQALHCGRHGLTADEPAELGGNDAGPNPYEYVLMALGSCTNMTLRMYAQMKSLPLDSVRTRLNLQHIHAKDCADCESQTGRVVEIQRDIELQGELSDEQRQKLLEIANKCPVHRLLTSEVKIRSQLVDPMPTADPLNSPVA